MLLLTEVLGSVLVLTVSSLLWKLNTHRRRFRGLVRTVLASSGRPS